MKICKECHIEMDDQLSFCPNCGAPVENTPVVKPQQPQQKEKRAPANQEPHLGIGMKIFIVVGLLALTAFSIFNYMSHRNDPEYTRTLIDPDSTLADKDLLILDTTSIDTAAAKKAEQEERKEAERVFNNIRRHTPTQEETESNTSKTENGENGESTEQAAPTTVPSEPAQTPPAAPAPKIEAIE